MNTPEFQQLLQNLTQAAGDLDASAIWPAQQFEWLAACGVLRATVPEQFGGTALSPVDVTTRYEALAAACLTTTFILTQRDGAVHRIAGSDNEDLKAELLPLLAEGRRFATVGISHLTTSRQHLAKPAVAVAEEQGGYRLSGTIPWVTGGGEADVIVTGGQLTDGRQMLIALPTNRDGVSVGDHVKLLALTASHTGAVELNDVFVESRQRLAGPVQNVMQQGTGGGAGSLTTSALAIGLAGRATRSLTEQAEQRADLAEIAGQLQSDYDTLHGQLLQAARGPSNIDDPSLSTESIRRRANSLALRSTQALLTSSKGAGFVQAHPAERAVREAMFFLVWSCPQPVFNAALREFACLSEQ